MNLRLFKFIAVVFSLLVLLSAPAFAAVTATLGDQNSSGEYRVKVDTDGVVTFASNTGILFPYEAATTSDTLTAAESGKTFVVAGATGSPPTYTLPVAAVGMEFTFVTANTVSVYLDPNGTDVFKYASLSAGDRIYNSSAAAGDTIKVFCATALEWAVTPIAGTWADAN